jgi:hypothetical protein
MLYPFPYPGTSKDKPFNCKSYRIQPEVSAVNSKTYQDLS